MLNIRRFTTGLKIEPVTSLSLDAKGELQVLSSSGKLSFHNGTSASPMVTEAHTATLTSKTLGDSGALTTYFNNILEGVAATDVTIRSASNQALNLTSQGTGNLTITAGGTAALSGASTSTIQSYTFTSSSLTTPTGSAGTLQSPSNQNLTVQAQGTGNLSLAGTQVTVFDTVFTSGTITGATGATLTLRSASNQNVNILSQGTGQLNLNAGSGGSVNVKNLVISNDTITGSSSSTLTLTTASNQSISVSPDGTGTITLAKATTFSTTLQITQTVDSSTTGSAQTVAPTTSNVKATNASLTSVAGFSSGTNGKLVTYVNGTGATLSVLNENAGASASDRILTGTGSDLSVADGASILLVYDNASSRWRIVGGSGGGGYSTNGSGTRASPTNVSAGTTVTVANAKQSLIYVQGNGASVTMTANPQLTTSGIDANNVLVVRGRNDTQTVTFISGNGLALRGNCTLAADDSLTLMFDGTNWVELSRS